MTYLKKIKILLSIIYNVYLDFTKYFYFTFIWLFFILLIDF